MDFMLLLIGLLGKACSSCFSSFSCHKIHCHESRESMSCIYNPLGKMYHVRKIISNQESQNNPPSTSRPKEGYLTSTNEYK